MHSSEREEIPTPIFRSTRQNKPNKPRSGKMDDNSEDPGYNYRMDRKRMIAVREDTVEDYTVTESTVAKPTVHSLNDDIVFDEPLHERFFKDSLTASQPEFIEIMENEMEVMCSVLMLQKVASWKKSDGFIEKGSSPKRQKLESQGLDRHRRSLEDIECRVKHESRFKPSEKHCLPRAWAKHAVTVKATRL